MRQKVQIISRTRRRLSPMHNILEAVDGRCDSRLEIKKPGNSLRNARNSEPSGIYVRFRTSFPGTGASHLHCKSARAQADLVVCDEPSRVDVSSQAQILNLMKRLQKEFSLSYLFIAHDLSVVQYMSDRIAVMYLGKIVEEGPADSLCRNCMHPYTKALLSAVPTPIYGEKRQRIILPGDVPSPIHPPTGCRFHTRCEYCMERCVKEEPKLLPFGEAEHKIACHLFSDGAQQTDYIDKKANNELLA